MPQLEVSELLAATIGNLSIPCVNVSTILEFAFPPRGCALRALLGDGRFAVDFCRAFDSLKPGLQARNRAALCQSVCVLYGGILP